MLRTGEELLGLKIQFSPSVGRQDVHMKQVTSQGRSWIMATMLADGVHLGVYGPLKLYVSKTDLLMCPCPMTPALFFPLSVNGSPSSRGSSQRPGSHNVLGSLAHGTPPNYQQILLVPSSKYMQNETISYCLHHHCLGQASFSLAEKAAMTSPTWPACAPAPTHCTIATLVSLLTL